MKNNEWEKQLKTKDAGFIDDGHFDGTAEYDIEKLRKFVSTLLAQTRQDTVREVIGNIIKQKQAVTINYDGPLNEIIENAQKLVIINDVGLEIIEQYGMKEEYGVEDE